MNIYLQHEQHGRKIATIEAEAVYDESNGWKRYDPDAIEPATVPDFLNQMRPTLHVKRQKRTL
jgi:hypothetical protein